ncbi:chlorohydrolase family protein [Aspergillus novofumigatus IBT 16806]|uniref:Guanine deaminase n=1 Tax=Aspergillus novofumigatus (strain IBT 16806) TaxID=1392255 RepID=A0A2I1C6X9_ASPN1|nr:chlorohydrolase family protein [Aspergillus novofumigatus IBT 16806]PKX93346.1 chlorohydrolase family protein [Aspergillus novofumigatus IBT 16806]
MATAPTYTLFLGTFIHLPRKPTGVESDAEWRPALDINHGALWVSNSDGKIAGFDWSFSPADGDVKALTEKLGLSGKVTEVVRAREERNEFFFPGFIDTHIHAPQYPNSGIFGSSTLLDWLETYTFPLESSFSDTSKARAVYSRVIARTLANGTTCASYFATIHVPATNLLASLCHARGQRALIGRVCMDNPSFCPDYYLDPSPESSVTKSKETIAHIHSIDPDSTLIKPILTPRFAPTCSPPALRGLAQLAQSYNPPLHIQTHLSENTGEVSLVRELFPQSKDYTSVYDDFGLLTPRTILAHAVHLSPSERELIAARGAKVSHCPASNSALGSGICAVRKLLEAGVEVGLGTDVSGGYNCSVLEAVRQGCLVSRLLRHSRTDDTGDGDDGAVPCYAGGAAVVDLAEEIGGFEVGMSFDAQMVRLGHTHSSAAQPTAAAEHGVVDVFGWESWTEKVHKWVWTGDDRNVRAVWVRGRLVHSLDEGQSQSDVSRPQRKKATWTGTGMGWESRWWLCGLGFVSAWFVFDRVMR